MSAKIVKKLWVRILETETTQFYGDETSWTAFYDLCYWRKTNKLGDKEKRVHLRGEADCLIRYFVSSDENYKRAINILKEKF